MAKYRKLPAEIEAYQTDKPMEIPTLEGVMHAEAGDWIITGVAGEVYPCKPDIFAATYEPVTDEPAKRIYTPQNGDPCAMCDYGPCIHDKYNREYHYDG